MIRNATNAAAIRLLECFLRSMMSVFGYRMVFISDTV